MKSLQLTQQTFTAFLLGLMISLFFSPAYAAQTGVMEKEQASTKLDQKKNVKKPAMKQPVNINTASAKAILNTLSGVGKVKAQAIVEHRERNGKV